MLQRFESLSGELPEEFLPEEATSHFPQQNRSLLLAEELERLAASSDPQQCDWMFDRTRERQECSKLQQYLFTLEPQNLDKKNVDRNLAKRKQLARNANLQRRLAEIGHQQEDAPLDEAQEQEFTRRTYREATPCATAFPHSGEHQQRCAELRRQFEMLSSFQQKAALERAGLWTPVKSEWVQTLSRFKQVQTVSPVLFAGIRDPAERQHVAQLLLPVALLQGNASAIQSLVSQYGADLDQVLLTRSRLDALTGRQRHLTAHELISEPWLPAYIEEFGELFRDKALLPSRHEYKSAGQEKPLNAFDLVSLSNSPPAVAAVGQLEANKYWDRLIAAASDKTSLAADEMDHLLTHRPPIVSDLLPARSTTVQWLLPIALLSGNSPVVQVLEQYGARLNRVRLPTALFDFLASPRGATTESLDELVRIQPLMQSPQYLLFLDRATPVLTSFAKQKLPLPRLRGITTDVWNASDLMQFAARKS